MYFAPMYKATRCRGNSAILIRYLNPRVLSLAQVGPPSVLNSKVSL